MPPPTAEQRNSLKSRCEWHRPHVCIQTKQDPLIKTLLHNATTSPKKNKNPYFTNFHPQKLLAAPVASLVLNTGVCVVQRAAGRSIWHYFRLCNTQWFWWLSIPIWTSNIVKRSKCSIHQTRLLHHSKECDGRRQQTDSRFKEEHTVGVVGENLSRNTEHKMSLENHYSVYYVTSFLCRTRRQNRAYECLVWLCVGLCVVVVMGVFKSLTEK